MMFIDMPPALSRRCRDPTCRSTVQSAFWAAGRCSIRLIMSLMSNAAERLQAVVKQSVGLRAVRSVRRLRKSPELLATDSNRRVILVRYSTPGFSLRVAINQLVGMRP